MPNSVGPRLPLQPLLDAVGTGWTARRVVNSGSDRTFEQQSTCKLLAELAGVSRRSIVRYRHDGIPWKVADRAAAALGKHPSEVWGNLWYEVTNR